MEKGSAKPKKPRRGSPRTRLTNEERRERILEAAREVFMRSGFAGARTREISRVAGVNEALLYQHFRSKEDLFEASVTEPLGATIDSLLAQGPAAGPEIWSSSEERRLDQVRDVIGTLFDGLQEVTRPLIALMLGDGDRGDDFYRQQISPALERLCDAVTEVRRYWGYPGVDPSVVVASAIGGCIVLMLDRDFGGTLLADRDQLVDDLTMHVVFGLIGPDTPR